MNLDDLARCRALDPQDMLGQIDGLPGQLGTAWDLGQGAPLVEAGTLRNVVLAGMGGSAIGADLLSAYVSGSSTLPILVWRNYGLPAFAGPESLVILSSHSGDTEETLSAFEAGRQRGVRLMAVTTGGELARRGEAAGVPTVRFEHHGQPRAAVGFSFGILLAVLSRLGIVPAAKQDIEGAVATMREQQSDLRLETPVVNNPAKRMAGQLMDRLPLIVGGGLLGPVARRWRTQIAEIAKAEAQFEELPEADHNMVAGVLHPETLISRTMAVFLRSALDHPRLSLRAEATRQVLMVEGFNTDVIDASGPSRLAHQWTCLHYGDYVAYYLAIAYGVDPTPVAAIQDLKARLKG